MSLISRGALVTSEKSDFGKYNIFQTILLKVLLRKKLLN